MFKKASTSSNRCKSTRFRNVSSKKCWNPKKPLKIVKNFKIHNETKPKWIHEVARSFVSKKTQWKNKSLKPWKNLRIYTDFMIACRFGSRFVFRMMNEWIEACLSEFRVVLGRVRVRVPWEEKRERRGRKRNDRGKWGNPGWEPLYRRAGSDRVEPDPAPCILVL